MRRAIFFKPCGEFLAVIHLRITNVCRRILTTLINSINSNSCEQGYTFVTCEAAGGKKAFRYTDEFGHAFKASGAIKNLKSRN